MNYYNPELEFEFDSLGALTQRFNLLNVVVTDHVTAALVQKGPT